MTNINAIRRMTTGASQVISDDIRNSRTSASAPNLLRAVVVEIFNDPLTLTTDQKTILRGTVANPNLVSIMPRDTISARIITAGQDIGDSTPKLFYPFLPPHIRLPIKAGETVWITFEDPSNTTDRGFWLWRVTEGMTVDDVNFTHADRTLIPSHNPDNITPTIRADISRGDRSNADPKPTFPNGAGQPGLYSLSQQGSINPFEKINNESLANQDFTFEPIPRFTKRPGDTVLAGSNNTRIVLGEDRTAGAKRTSADKRGQAGAVDFVVGAGRVLPANETTNPGQSGSSTTTPRTIENARRKQETDKTPYLHNAVDNLKEGDPDFVNDVSRVYMAQKTDGDVNFNLSPSLPESFDSPIQPLPEKGYIVIKSDQLRLLARKEQNGSIRIIKEGTNGRDGDACSVLLLNDGTVQIDGKKIYIGRSGGQGPGIGGSEPYIKYSEFEKRMNELLTEVESLRSQVDAIRTTLITAFNASIALPGLSIVALQSAATSVLTPLQAPLTTIQTNLQIIRQKIILVKSARIFGE
jgi:hypothetical protein